MKLGTKPDSSESEEDDEPPKKKGKKKVGKGGRGGEYQSRYYPKASSHRGNECIRLLICVHFCCIILVPE